MAIARILVVGMLLVTPAGVALSQETVSPRVQSATKARDVGGFALGSNIRDAAKLVPVESIGNGGYQAVSNGIRYDFGVTPLGRIYRVDSEQDLGRFVVNDAFLATLRSKLTAKYGAPIERSGETFRWSLIEPVKRTGDRALPFEMNWAAAYVSGDPDEVTLHIKLIDFRIMWQDARALNRRPENEAASKIAF